MPEESGILGFGIWNTAQRIRNPWLTWIPFHRVKELFQIWFLCLFFFERTFCFTKFFLQEVLRKNKVFHFSKKSRYSCYWDRKSSIYTSCLKHLTSSIIRKSKKLRAVWESQIISASSCSSSATPPQVWPPSLILKDDVNQERMS